MSVPVEGAYGHVMPLGDDVAPALLAKLAHDSTQPAAVRLAHSLAASPPAATMPDVVLAVRHTAPAVLAFSGAADTAARARLAELPSLLSEAGDRLRLVDWEQVEDLVVRLGQRIRDQFDDEDLADATLVGAPRGGSIVAGLLAYALDVPRERVTSGAPGGLSVLVDDASISGVRLRELIRDTPSDRIAVATLLSPPELRDAVVSCEPRVIAFSSGGDLHDHGPSLLDDYDGWRETWTARVPGRYYTGLVDLVAFPWSEPDLRMWNPVTATVEPNWWLAPVDRCLAHRVSPPHLQVQIVEENPAYPWLPERALPVEHADATALLDIHGGPGARLAGVARELWSVWVHDADRQRAASEVAAAYEQPVRRVRADLDRMLADLRARELLRDG